jgi:hypothetical protein
MKKSCARKGVTGIWGASCREIGESFRTEALIRSITTNDPEEHLDPYPAVWLIMTPTMEQMISVWRSRGNLREAADEIFRGFWTHFASRLHERVTGEHLGDSWTVLNLNQAEEYLPPRLTIVLDYVDEEHDPADLRMVFRIEAEEHTVWFILEWMGPRVHPGFDADRYDAFATRLEDRWLFQDSCGLFSRVLRAYDLCDAETVSGMMNCETVERLVEEFWSLFSEFRQEVEDINRVQRSMSRGSGRGGDPSTIMACIGGLVLAVQ